MIPWMHEVKESWDVGVRKLREWKKLGIVK
jgi:hypothetical protein